MALLRKLMGFIAIVAAFNVVAQEADYGDDLYGQVEALQDRMHIQIVGLDNLGDEPKIRARGSLEQQLESALAGYNHAISRNAKGKIEKVVIMARKQASSDHRIIVTTRSEGGHLLVPLAISATGAYWEEVEMIVDTGADLLVLPLSMIEKLGVGEGTLSPRLMQTANGKSNALIGKLQSVKIAGENIENVGVAFIDDSLLGNKGLLGMSALGRYKLVIDHEETSVMLIKK